jgi:Asp-tRNA(Asn)/Glu-tRNA(Gln) amidotransferase A subunit family amidase
MGRTKAGLPMGLQVVGGPFGEQDLLSLSWDLEEAMPWQQVADASAASDNA